MNGRRGRAARSEAGGRIAEHREAVENSLLRGGVADVVRVIGASVAVAAAAAAISLVAALLY